MRHILKVKSCWIWTLKLTDGYGRIKVDSVNRLVHVFAYETFTGPVPPGHIVRHTCDSRPCINPDHLVLGTHRDNARDRSLRGRNNTASGSKHWTKLHPEWIVRAPHKKHARTCAALAPDVVDKIYNQLESGKFTKADVARQLGLSPWTVYKRCSRKKNLEMS
jgi:hypothetical protein